jgi:Tol biopolymer transport system component
VTNNIVADFLPSWSPDGSKIAYAGRSTETIGYYKIYIMNADGSGKHFITGKLTNYSEYCPSWSPDGSKIAFERDTEICVMDADGNNQRNLTNSPATDRNPAWSPDGKKIAFDSMKDVKNQKVNIRIMDMVTPKLFGIY